MSDQQSTAAADSTVVDDGTKQKLTTATPPPSSTTAAAAAAAAAASKFSALDINNQFKGKSIEPQPKTVGKLNAIICKRSVCIELIP